LVVFFQLLFGRFGCDVGVTKEDDLVGRSERQVDKEIVGCDVGMTKEDDLVGGSERQVDKETVGCDVGVTKEKGVSR
jgi:hypothetical protein